MPLAGAAQQSLTPQQLMLSPLYAPAVQNFHGPAAEAEPCQCTLQVQHRFTLQWPVPSPPSEPCRCSGPLCHGD